MKHIINYRTINPDAAKEKFRKILEMDSSPYSGMNFTEEKLSVIGRAMEIMERRLIEENSGIFNESTTFAGIGSVSNPDVPAGI